MIKPNTTFTIFILLAMTGILAASAGALPGDVDQSYGATGFYRDDFPGGANFRGHQFHERRARF